MPRTITALLAGAALCAAPAHAVPITLGFALGSEGCGADAIGTAITIAQSSCAPQGGHQYLTPGDRLTLRAAPGTTFDYLALNTLVFWQEIFAIPAANLPAGLNPASQSGHDALWRTNEWALATNPLPILHTRGYKSGALIADWNPPLIDTYDFNALTGGGSGLDIETRNIASPPLTGLDRLEFSFMDNYLPADGELARLVDDTWYTVSSGPLWAFTDLTLDIHTASRPPTPVPLSPALAFLLLAFGSLAAIAQRKTTHPQ